MEFIYKNLSPLLSHTKHSLKNRKEKERTKKKKNSICSSQHGFLTELPTCNNLQLLNITYLGTMPKCLATNTSIG